MVLPLVPVGLAGLGILGGVGLSSLWGGSKKESAVSTVTHAPYETYAPQTSTQNLYSPQYAVQIESPGSKITKKDKLIAESAQEASLPQTYMTGTGGGGGGQAGADMTQLAIIGIIGLIAYGVVTKK